MVSDLPAMRCPHCGQENRDGSVFCQNCGKSLAEAAPQPAPAPQPLQPQQPQQPAQPEPTPAQTWAAPPAEEEQVSHRGQTYAVGWGPTYYAVWDLRTGQRVAGFDRTAIGWETTWHRFQELESRTTIPSWRRPNAWIVAHIGIAILIWFVELFLVGIVLAAAGRETQDAQLIADAMGGSTALALLTALVGWMLFVYLRKSPGVRWITLLVLLIVGFAVMTAVGLANLPVAFQTLHVGALR